MSTDIPTGNDEAGEVSPDSKARLPRVLGAAGLTSLGIGGTIGTGIFVIAGSAARDVAGPAIILSFIVAALVCGCAALCYSDLSARYPQAGSAYAYGRVLIGGVGAWLIGWNLILQYTLAAASIAQGWSHYFQDSLMALSSGNFRLPTVLQGAGGSPPGALLDICGFFVVVGISTLLLRGLKLSVGINHVIVAIKLAIVALVIVVGAFYVHPANWLPFAPFGWGGLSIPGVSGGTGAPHGMMAGAAIVFYAFLGFEALTNYSEETKLPESNVRQGILRSLAICTLLYIAMATVLTGMVPYNQISREAPISEAFGQVGLPWIRTIVAIGALAGISSVLLVILLSLPRILLAVARDGILPQNLSATVDGANGVPILATIVTGVIVALLAGIVPLNALGVVAVQANLLTFVVVGILVFVQRQRDRNEGRKPTLTVVIPIITILACPVLMLSLPPFGWAVLGLWLLIGTGLFFLRRHS